MTADQLHIESTHGQSIIDYRIRRGQIEVRCPGEEAEPTSGEVWRRLSAREFSAHLAQNPALAYWLRARAQRPSPRTGEAPDEASAA